MEFLFRFEPDFIKIAPFFTREIDNDPKKRLAVSKLLEIAHHVGSTVAATDVRVRSEYHALRSLGVDMIQGSLVDGSEKEPLRLKSQFKKIHFLSQQAGHKDVERDKDLVSSEIERPEPIPDNLGIFEVFEKFKQNKDATFFSGD